MFYSQFILAKKGPLGTIWIAAHLERKLRKNQVTETNIGVSVDSILFPEVPIALRLSGHLLLGVVRIYSRKVNYLFNDCSEALSKIKQAFHTGAVDLPPEAATAPFHSITLPENFDLDDLELLPDQEAVFLANSSTDHHVTSREQITLQEPIDDHMYLSSQYELDERFPDLDAPRFDFEEDVFYLKPHDKEIEQDDAEALAEDPVPSSGVEEQPEQMNVDDQDPTNLNERVSSAPDLMELDNQPEPSADAAKLLDINEAPEVEPEESEPKAAEVDEASASLPDGPVEISGSAEHLEQEVICNNTEQAQVPEPEDAVPVQAAEVTKAVITETGDADTVVEIAATDTVAEEAEVTNDAVEAEATNTETEAETTNSRAATEGLEDVPDVEKLRSSANIQDAEQNILDLGDAEGIAANQDHSEGSMPMKNVEETPTLKQDASTASPPSAVSEFPEVASNDLLASILGRRSSALRVAPTPSDLPAKRQKTGPRQGLKKRKIKVDASSVLHGDAMRQQLADTSDVRRVRRRVPCTENEIWELEMEAFGPQIFEQPSLLGLCDNLIEVYHSVHSAYGTSSVVLEPEAGTAKSGGPKPIDLDPQETFEAVSLAEKPYYEFDDIYDRLRQEDIDGNGHADDKEDPSNKEASTEPQVSSVQEIVSEQETIEQLVHSTVDIQDEPAEGAQLPVETVTTSTGGGDAQDLQPPETHPTSPLAEDHQSLPNAIDEAEDASHTENVVDATMEPAVSNSFFDNMPDLKEAAEPVTAAEAIIEPEAEAVIYTEEVIQESHQAETERVEAAEPNAGPADEHEAITAAGHSEPEPDQAPANDAVETVPVVPTSNEDDESPVEALGFLTDAKDADDEAAFDDGYGEDHSENQVQDNSGWSVRTRAVCQYLRFSFESMETSRKQNSDQERPKLSLERLLQGKSRREAARMFFETLVLKTKDFVNVEQASAFDKIVISPRAKLMKSDL